MTLSLLLSSWRARWGKPSGSSLLSPYSQGKVVQWMIRICDSDIWALTGFSVFVLLGCATVFLFTPSVQLTMNGQIVWGVLLCLFAVGARRYDGEVFMWLVAGMSLLITARYFYWRASTTLDFHLGADFFLGFIFLIAEFYLWLLGLIVFIKRNIFDKLSSHAPLLGFVEEVMRFYRPVIYGIVVTAPLIALVWRLPMVHASPAVLASYTIPHWILCVFVVTSQETKGRLPITALIGEYLAAAAVLGRTIASYIKSEWRYGFGRSAKVMQADIPNFSIAEKLEFGARLTLFGGVGLGVCAREGSNLWRAENEMYVIYLIWAIYNLSLVIAEMAAGRESLMVRKVLKQQSNLAAMVRLPTGHILACRTKNFPSRELALHFPAEVLIPSTELQLSIFKGHREYTFTVHLHRQLGREAWLLIDGACVDEYEALGNAVFSRNAAWPAWLPGRHADQVLPLWTQRFIEVLETTFYNQIMRFSKNSLWQLCIGWFKRGK